MVLPVTVMQSPWSSPASSSSLITTGTPPIRSRSTMTYRPPGLRSAMCGVCLPIRSNSSMARSMPASWAMAGRCRTAFVDPPIAQATAMAFSKARRVMMSDGRISLSSSPTTASPEAWESPSRRGSRAGIDADIGSDIPSASEIAAIVFAVNMPAQDPAPGQAARSSSPRSASDIVPAETDPTPSKTSWIVTSRSCQRPGMIVPP